jgi:small subunit ribosomal protein S20
MPIIKSAKKRVRQAKKRQAYNTATKAGVKKQFRAVRDELATGKPKSNAALVAAIAEIDKAVKRGVIHKKTAARKKSRLTRAYNAVATKPYGTEAPGKPGSKKKAVKKPVAKKAVAKKTPAKKVTKKPTAKK